MNPVSKLKIDPAGLTATVVVEDENDGAQESAGSIVVIDDEDGEPSLKKTQLPPEAKLNDDGTVTLTLSKPVALTVKKSSGKTSEEVYKTLTFREMTGLDRRLAAQAPENQREVTVVARSAGITTVRMSAIMDLLTMRDITRIEKVITFLSE